MTPAPVIFYISGHGFGHAVRQCAIINALLQSGAGRVRVVIRTSAPEWLFARTLRGPFTLLPGETDTGVAQIDGLRLDEHATIRQAVAFHESWPQRVVAEAAILRAHDAALVVSDAPPLACAAADLAGVPSVVCANFTWDWIYQEYVATDASADHLIRALRLAYSTASAGWRLPMHGGFDALQPIVDVPLVARRASTDRSIDEVREALYLPAGRPLALVSFGGYGAKGLPLDRLDCLRDWGVVLTCPPASPAPAVRGVEVVAEELIYRRGLQYEDLVRAVDVVVTKPGYGIISDCAANDTAALYSSRGRFAEYDVLVREMPRWVRSRFLATGDLLEGRWKAGLDAARAAPAVREKPGTGGAAAVAGLILETVGAT